mmetsp:Transcript_164699/g.528384  ORF Transcript_164699/g.528384 Transcript_164699/m.528384 type:complete len:231 (-) Transcript_164699:854-1546(-)
MIPTKSSSASQPRCVSTRRPCRGGMDAGTAAKKEKSRSACGWSGNSRKASTNKISPTCSGPVNSVGGPADDSSGQPPGRRTAKHWAPGSPERGRRRPTSEELGPTPASNKHRRWRWAPKTSNVFTLFKSRPGFRLRTNATPAAEAAKQNSSPSAIGNSTGLVHDNKEAPDIESNPAWLGVRPTRMESAATTKWITKWLFVQESAAEDAFVDAANWPLGADRKKRGEANIP